MNSSGREQRDQPKDDQQRLKEWRNKIWKSEVEDTPFSRAVLAKQNVFPEIVVKSALPPREAFQTEIERFVKDIRWRRGGSEQTVRSYRTDLRQFAAYMNKHNLEGLNQVTLDIARQWVWSLRDHGYATATAQRKVSTLKSFFLWAYREGLLGENPLLNLKRGQSGKQLPRVLTESHVQQMLERLEAALYAQGDSGRSQPQAAAPAAVPAAEVSAAPTAANPNVNPNAIKGSAKANLVNRAVAARNRAILELLYATAMRVAELAGLNLEDLDLARRTATVLGKGQRQRVVPFGEPASRALEDWLLLRPRLLPESAFKLVNRRPLDSAAAKALFLGVRGGRMGTRAVYALVSQLIDPEGKDDDGSPPRGPHVFRHSAATHMLNHGAELRGLQEFLGHKNLATTQRYTQVSVEHLRQVYRQSHPRA